MKYIVSPLWALLTTAILYSISISNLTFLQIIELKFLDQLIITEPVIDDTVVLVDISEKALQNHGQFPFPRDVYGNLIQSLRQANAGIIVLTLSFPEEDRTGQDAFFTEMLSQGVVIAHYPTEKSQSRTAYATGIAEIGEPAAPYVYSYSGIAGNIEKYEKQASGIGIANTIPEIDGVVRRLPMISESNGILYPSIVLEVLKAYSGTNTYQIKTSPAGIEAVRVKKFPKIETDGNSRVWINPNIVMQRYEMDDVFPDLKGKTVFIGVTAEGISNPVPTANGAKYGHDIIASAMTSVLSGYNIIQPHYAQGLRDTAVLCIGLLIVLLSYISYIKVLPLLAIPGLVYACFYVFATHNIILNPINAVLAGAIVSLHVYGVKYVQEFLAKQQIKKQFGTYLSPAMVEKLQKNPELLKLGGETKYMTFLFCDIRGFTPISEQYQTDPQGLTELVNRFLTPMTDIIMNNEGTIDKYMGDCIMAFWNAPLDVDDQEHKAVKTSMEMYASLELLNLELEADGLLPINIGIGINTGLVVVGNMGSNQRFDYSVLGDAVNLAARLEGQTKEYGVKTIIGHDTRVMLDDNYTILKLDTLAVKGKTEPVEIYTILEESDLQNTSTYYSDMIQHHKMLELYKTKHFEMAIHYCNELKGSFAGVMDEYYDIWIQRCMTMKKARLPAKWDGVYRATSK